jgi:hypothetical protein
MRFIRRRQASVLLRDNPVCRWRLRQPAAPCSACGRLAGLGIECGVHRLDQIALHRRRLVLRGRKRDDDLERVFGCAAVEQHARRRVSEHARMGFDDGAGLFDRQLELGPLRRPEAHLAGMWRRRIDAEVAQELAPDAAIGTIICALSSVTSSVQNLDSSLTVPTLSPTCTLWPTLKGRKISSTIPAARLESVP